MGVEQGRLDPPPGKDHAQRVGIGHHLALVRGRHLGQRRRHRAAGLEIDDADDLGADAQPVDGAGDDGAVGQGRGDRRLGERVGAEQAGELGVLDDRQRRRDDGGTGCAVGDALPFEPAFGDGAALGGRDGG